MVEFASGSGRLSTKSFTSESRAKAWMTMRQGALSRYGPLEHASDPYVDTLGDLLERYGRDVSSQKRGATVEGYRIGKLRRSLLAALPVAELTSKAIADYRTERSAEVSSSAIRSEISLIRRTLETARREWGYQLLTNVAALVALPAPSAARDRRLRAGEYEALRDALAGHPLAWAYVRFAIETAMRRGEILSLRWRDAFLSQGCVHIPKTKNGRPRTVPLTDEALNVLKALKPHGEYVFPIDVHALRWAWTTACKRAGIQDLRLHDLRHEGVSRLLELGLSPPEVATVSGHLTLSQLMRYTHPDAQRIRAKLAGRRTGQSVE
ncbi:integrase [Sphingomonas trueperi]|uniref:site-specific integrase n=1 Tax=Sphingomonas trueperi TaxID=53317 RepID=UPI00339347DB